MSNFTYFLAIIGFFTILFFIFKIIDFFYNVYKSTLYHNNNKFSFNIFFQLLNTAFSGYELVTEFKPDIPFRRYSIESNNTKKVLSHQEIIKDSFFNQHVEFFLDMEIGKDYTLINDNKTKTFNIYLESYQH